MDEFLQSEDLSRNSLAWGAPELVPDKWRKIREAQVDLILCQLIDSNESDYVCDFSAGAGYYTLQYAKYFSAVIHCDLSMQNLNYCYKKASQTGIDNIFFLRIDYFHPPFNNSLKNVICIDSLIRGIPHEERLLSSIKYSLADDGFAYIDFHNWWHNPLRRLGFLKNNFGNNKSYTRKQAQSLIYSKGLKIEEYIPFWQEAQIYQKNIFTLLPPTRLAFKVSKKC
jgi:ubiquinone/menaquinone biosynthesis C-methylase UbiE